MRRTAFAIVSTHPSASQNDSTTSVPVLMTVLLAEVENIVWGDGYRIVHTSIIEIKIKKHSQYWMRMMCRV